MSVSDLRGLRQGPRLPAPFDADPPAGRILEIASTLGLSACDASYLVTAELLHAPFVTEDARLLRAAPEMTRSLASSLHVPGV